MIINPSKSEDRIIMLKAGFSEKEIGEIYNRLMGNIIIEVEWDGAQEIQLGWQQIDDADMKKLYQLKQKTGKPITILVREAVKEYLENNKGRLG